MAWKSTFIRRFFINLLPLTGFILCFPKLAKAQRVTITSFGHSALLIKAEGKSVLINPFKAVGCTKGLKEPKVNANVILASSELADEGARVARGPFLVKPGSYRIKGIAFEGFAAPHDRVGGRRFGQATIWRWKQGGLNFAHLGGSAAPLKPEDKILIGRPDVLIIGVGGSSKVYNGAEASEIVKILNPRRVIPVQYLDKRSPKSCDLNTINSFIDAMEGIEIQKSKRILNLPKKLGDRTIIEIIN